VKNILKLLKKLTNLKKTAKSPSLIGLNHLGNLKGGFNPIKGVFKFKYTNDLFSWQSNPIQLAKKVKNAYIQ